MRLGIRQPDIWTLALVFLSHVRQCRRRGEMFRRIDIRPIDQDFLIVSHGCDRLTGVSIWVQQAGARIQG